MTTLQALRWSATRFHPMLCCAFFLAGCVQVGPKQLQVPRGIVAERPAAEPRKPCPDILPPIPPVAHITIEPGKPVDADAGGEALLRAYIAQREWTLKNR